jgi:hypothetical protein
VDTPNVVALMLRHYNVAVPLQAKPFSFDTTGSWTIVVRHTAIEALPECGASRDAENELGGFV